MENLVTEDNSRHEQSAREGSKFEGEITLEDVIDVGVDVDCGGASLITPIGEDAAHSSTEPTLENADGNFNLPGVENVENSSHNLSDLNLESYRRKTRPVSTDEESECNSLTDDERMALYEKAVDFKRLGNASHSLLCFLDCLRGLQPGCNSKFAMLPQCLTHVAQLYALHEDYQRAVEFMLAAKLYYEIAIIEKGAQIDEFEKETDSGYRPLDLEPSIDEAKRANEYEKLSYSCLEKEKFQLALDYCGKATKLRQQVYGDDHPVTSKTIDLFTLIYAEMGKSQYSETLRKHVELEKAVVEEEEKKKQEEKHFAEDVDSTKEEIKVAPIKTTVEITGSKKSHEPSSTETEKMVSFSNVVLEENVVSSSSSRNNNADDNNEDKINNKNSSNECRNNSVEEEGIVSLITPKQFLLIFIFSATASIFLTWLWCRMFESDSCPSRHYIKRTLKHFYYYYIVPHKYA